MKENAGIFFYLSTNVAYGVRMPGTEFSFLCSALTNMLSHFWVKYCVIWILLLVYLISKPL